MRSIGPEISIRFGDASGLRIGQTPVNYRGVQIGEVSRIELSDDRKQARGQGAAASLGARRSRPRARCSGSCGRRSA